MNPADAHVPDGLQCAHGGAHIPSEGVQKGQHIQLGGRNSASVGTALLQVLHGGDLIALGGSAGR